MNDIQAVPKTDLDPFTRESIRNGIAYSCELREVAPIMWLEKYGCYATGQFQIAQQILHNWKGFTSTVKAFGPRTFIPNILVTDDPPDHARVRTPLMKLLTPVALNRYKAQFDVEAAALVERLLERGTVDGMKDIAAAFVLKVFPDLIGLPPDNRENLLVFGDLAFNSNVPLNDVYQESLQRAGNVLDWVAQQCERDSTTPGGMAAAIYEYADRGELTEDEARLLVRAVLAGGFDTTVLSISSALRAFSLNPDQWTLLRENPALLKPSFEESMRFDPPTRFLGRGVAADVEIEGVQLREGDKIACFLIGAGRDPRRWEHPDRFDISRKAAGHLSFGHGIHNCVGQALARLEYASLTEALAKRVARLEPVGEAQRVINNQACGWESVPLKLHAA